MVTHSFEALGTHFTITLWSGVDSARAQVLFAHCEAVTHAFDALYSRFKADSLVTKLSKETGMVTVPQALVAMLRLYGELNAATAGKINPAVGFALEDSGYDATYSLLAKAEIRPVPALSDALTVIDDTHIELHQPVLLDLGALGKGFIVDELYAYLLAEGVERFLVDGSGDVRYFDIAKQPIVCGLEDPRDATKVIGTRMQTDGALCASATNRRRWGDRHHYIDPEHRTSPELVAATWVVAKTAALADGLSSALFFVAAEDLVQFDFEYLIVNHEMRTKKSAGFAADFF